MVQSFGKAGESHRVDNQGGIWKERLERRGLTPPGWSLGVGGQVVMHRR